MTPFYSDDAVTLHCGDCREVLAAMPEGSAQTCITSPPYFGLRDYGHAAQIGLERTPDEYVAELVRVFREVRRVLADDGTLWLNLGDSYAREGGKTAGVPRHWDGRAHDPGGQHHTRHVDNLGGAWKAKDLLGIPWRVAFALQSDGWYLRSDIIWHKPNPMPESVTDRPTKAHEYLFLLAKSARYYYDADAIAEQSSGVTGGGGSRQYAENQPRHGAMRLNRPQSDGTRNRRSVWTVATKPYRGAHFATFPPDLITPCVLAGAPVGGVVLDPFGGSGTTGAVAKEHGRKAVLIEANPDYCALAVQRWPQHVLPMGAA